MMRRSIFALALACLTLASVPASGQIMSARRMAMGGVILSGGGPGSEGANVAYRAVPPPRKSGASLPLPIGAIPLIQDPPITDTNDPQFNAYRLANLLYNLPWNYPLREAEAPSSDITIAVSKNSLAIDLGEVRDIFPDDRSRIGAVATLPLLTLGVKRMFVSLNPLVHWQNELGFNDALHGALAHGQAFAPNTRYEATDRATAQVAAGVALGFAAPLVTHGDPRGSGFGLYVGARGKVLRGLAYGDADNVAAFTTSDTLFGSDPVDVGYHALLRDAAPDGGGAGFGADVGAVMVVHGLELGVGVNDLGTSIDWRVRETEVVKDTAGDYQRITLGEGIPYTSTVPVTVTGTAATRVGAVALAADVVRGPFATTAHAGAELWLGHLALRAGAEYDANALVQGSGGLGLRLGRFGVDAAAASNSRNVARSRAVDLGVSLTLYPGTRSEKKEATP
jgi:hypothetical protein